MLEKRGGDSEEVWHELSDRFFHYEDDISSLLVNCVKANRDQFN